MLECIVVYVQVLKTTTPPDADIQNSNGMRILDSRAFCIHSVKDCIQLTHSILGHIAIQALTTQVHNVNFKCLC